MIKQLSIHRLLLFFVAALSLNTANAQLDTIKTAYAAPNLGNIAVLPPSAGASYFITFKVENTNNYPILLKDLDFLHFINNNGGSYLLWASRGTNAVGGGNPSFNATDGWKLLKASAPINTATSGFTQIFKDLDIVLSGKNCDSNQIRFALEIADTLYIPMSGFVATPGPATPYTPATWTNGGVVLHASSAGERYGYRNTNNNQNWAINNIGQVNYAPGAGYAAGSFWGSVSFDATPTAVVPAAPEVVATPNPICPGDTVMLTARFTDDACVFPNRTFNWTWAGGGSATGDTIYVAPGATTNYNVTVTSKGLYTSAPATIRVVVNNPLPPLVTGKFNYCVNEQFVPLEVQADSVLWYYTEAGGSPIPTYPTINTSLGAHKDTFYVSQWQNGCISKPRTRVILSAANKPSPPIVETPIYRCAGDITVPLEATGQNLVWYYFPTGGIPSTIAPTPPTSVADTLSYFVAQDNDGCESDREQIDVFVVFRPNGLIEFSDDQICMNDTVTFGYYGSAFEDAGYIWSTPPSATYVDQVSGRGPIRVIFQQPGKYDFTLQVGYKGCFSPVYAQSIQVDSIPSAVISAKDFVCPGAPELVSLETYDKSIDTFRWDFGAGAETTHFSTDQGPYGVIWHQPGEQEITLTIIDGACDSVIKKKVDVRLYPDAKILVENPSTNGVYCAGDSIKFRANTINSATQYEWSPNRYFDEYNTLSTAYGVVDFTGYVKLHVTDQFGCEATDSAEIKTEPCCKLTFPSAFSPNNDGKNDRFRLLNVNNMENYNRTNSLNYDVKTFRVVNRWGVTVFESNNELMGWDGNFNGEPQDMGTYYWFISYMCGGKQVSEKGEVVLVR